MRAAVFGVLLAWCIPAHADDIEEAERLFREATEALESGDAARGRDLLRRSLALHETVPTCANLAIALCRAGDTPGAVELFERALDEECGPVSQEERGVLAQQLRRARAQLATLMVSVCGVARASLELDGEPAGTAACDVASALSVGAGQHTVVAEADGSRARRRVEIAAGERLALEIALEPRVDLVEPETRRSRTWLWVTLVGVVVGGAALGVGLALRGGNSVDARYETLR